MANSRLGLRTRPGLVRAYTEGIAGGDADATLFLEAAGITDTTIISAIQQLVIDLKVYGLWSKCKTIYPFVGGTASTHKWNLRDPRDLDAAFRLVFSGGWTHTSTGATPNGTTGWANTFFNPFLNLSNASAHLSNYLRSSMSSGGFGGVGVASVERMDFIVFGGNLLATIGGNATQASTSSTPYQSLIIGSRTSATSMKLYTNNVLRDTKTGTNSTNLPNLNLYLGARNGAGNVDFYGSNQIAFSSIGDGLTDQEAADLYTAVQAFQTTLGRQV